MSFPATGKIRIVDWEKAVTEALKPLPWEVLAFEQVGSTMDEARKLINRVTHDRAGLVIARDQTRGKGRQGREWLAASDALYVTFVFATSAPLKEISGFSLVAGCSVVRVIEDLGAKAGLKWPNDIMSENKRKLGGILIDVVSRGSEHYVLAGIGLNLVSGPAVPLMAADLSEVSGVRITAPDFAVRLAKVVLADWQEFLVTGFKGFRERWLKSALYLGGKISVDTGHKLVSGKMAGITESGSLLVEEHGRTEEVISGHVVKIESE